MKVLYVLKRYPRLSETFVVREILGIEALGVEVVIDALLPPEDEPRHAALAEVRAVPRYLPRRARLVGDGCVVPLLRLVATRPRAVGREALQAARRHRRGAPRAWRQFRYAVLVADRCRREDVTQLHAHFATAAAEVAGPAGRMAGVPVSVTAHAKDIFHRDNAPELIRRLRGLTSAITVSTYNAEHLRRVIDTGRSGARMPVVRHVPNGVAVRAGSPSGVGKREAPVLCVARLVAKKGIDTLLSAIAIAVERDPQLRLEVIGAGPLLAELTDLAATLGIAELVTFRGALAAAEVEAAYDRCALVALACRITDDGDRDGLPTVLVEALGRGVPVIATDVVGIPELVRHAHNGLIVAPDDPAGLASAIEELRSDPDRARSWGAAGRDLVRADYDPEVSARALSKVWLEVVR